jgi:hypothetical protein
MVDYRRRVKSAINKSKKNAKKATVPDTGERYKQCFGSGSPFDGLPGSGSTFGIRIRIQEV